MLPDIIEIEDAGLQVFTYLDSDAFVLEYGTGRTGEGGGKYNHGRTHPLQFFSHLGAYHRRTHDIGDERMGNQH